MKTPKEQYTMVAPLLIVFSALVIPMYTGNIKDFNFFILIIIADIFNYVLKHHVFEPIMGNKTYPLIGQGKRPDGAKGTGIFASEIKSTTYGMPSGHAQGVSLFVTYLITNRIMKSNDSIIVKMIYSSLLIAFAIYVMYGRVVLTKAHTTQQVVIGSLIGIIIVLIHNRVIVIKK
jgi:membrane-associated phospholipid phosphatase